jgi:hypothetical protein
MAEEMTLVMGYLMAVLFKRIRLFAVSISTEFLQRERPTQLQTLALSAFGLLFCVQLVRLIKSKLISTKAPKDVVEELSSATTTELNATCNAVMKRIENIHLNSAEAESSDAQFEAGAASKKATEMTEEVGSTGWLQKLMRDSLLGRIPAEVVRAGQGLKEKVVQGTDLDSSSGVRE